MKSQMTLQAKVQNQQPSAIAQWMQAEHKLFTAIIGQSVTNRQMLLISHACIAFTALLLFSSSVIFSLLTLSWFIFSLQLCRKGGLK